MFNYLFVKFYLISAVYFFAGTLLLQESVDALESKSLVENNEGSLEGTDFLNGRDWWDRDWNKKGKFKCPSSEGSFSDIEDCSKYYVCNNGKASHKSCSRKKQFDRYRKKCMPFVVAVCDDGKDDKVTISSTPDAISTTKRGNKFSCPSFRGNFPDPEDCSKYYSCSFLIPTLNTCPEDELFDGVQNECKPANRVHCGSRKRPTGKTSVPTTPLISSTPPDTTTVAPTHEPTTTESTTLEITTTESTTLEITTTESTTLEITTTESTTLEPTTTESTTLEPTTAESTTPEPTTTESTTPEPTTTEPTTTEPTGPPDNDCDEDDVDCIITETGGENPNWFKCPEPVGSYGHPSSVKLFIFCKNWKPYVKRCGQDLVYSNDMRTCVSP